MLNARAGPAALVEAPHVRPFATPLAPMLMTPLRWRLGAPRTGPRPAFITRFAAALVAAFLVLISPALAIRAIGAALVGALAAAIPIPTVVAALVELLTAAVVAGVIAPFLAGLTAPLAGALVGPLAPPSIAPVVALATSFVALATSFVALAAPLAIVEVPPHVGLARRRRVQSPWRLMRLDQWAAHGCAARGGDARLLRSRDRRQAGPDESDHNGHKTHIGTPSAATMILVPGMVNAR